VHPVLLCIWRTGQDSCYLALLLKYAVPRYAKWSYRWIYRIPLRIALSSQALFHFKLFVWTSFFFRLALVSSFSFLAPVRRRTPYIETSQDQAPPISKKLWGIGSLNIFDVWNHKLFIKFVV
jgi:hypothetical protein